MVIRKALLGLSLSSAVLTTQALSLKPDMYQFTIGAFTAHQGKDQSVNVVGLIGDNYTVTKHNDQNVLIGAGVFKHYNQTYSFGLNIFYLAKTKVNGLIYQEKMFDNLGYTYGIAHVPILFTAKGSKPLKSKGKAITFDIGIGPNIMRAYDFNDYSRDGGVTQPNHAFESKTQAEFAASAGLALHFDNVIKGYPIDIGYRFFYLGNGQLSPRINLIQNSLQTGHVYAHSITLSTSLER